MDDIYETIYWFIIDTDHPHATLFDDELAAHITGLVGDCKRGLRIAECARADKEDSLDWIRDAIFYRPYGDDCLHPATAVQTPDAVLGQCAPEQKRGEKSYPRYQSIAITFRRPLTAQEILQLRRRAQSFVTDDLSWMEQGSQITILGYRLNRSVRIENSLATYPPMPEGDGAGTTGPPTGACRTHEKERKHEYRYALRTSSTDSFHPGSVGGDKAHMVRAHIR